MPQSIRRIPTGVCAALLVGLVAACTGINPSISPGPVGSSAPGSSASPTSSPSSEPGSTRVALETATGNVVTIDVSDASATVLETRSGKPGDGASVEPYVVRVTNDDPTTLRLVWVGGPCDAHDSLAIDATARQFMLVQPECSGDAVAFDRILLLRFSAPIDAGQVQAILQDGTDS